MHCKLHIKSALIPLRTAYRSAKQSISRCMRRQQEGCRDLLTCRVSRGFCCGKDGSRSHSSKSGMRSLGRSNVAVLHDSQWHCQLTAFYHRAGRQAHGHARQLWNAGDAWREPAVIQNETWVVPECTTGSTCKKWYPAQWERLTRYQTAP